jgi:hypothetical protein
MPHLLRRRQEYCLARPVRQGQERQLEVNSHLGRQGRSTCFRLVPTRCLCLTEYTRIYFRVFFITFSTSSSSFLCLPVTKMKVLVFLPTRMPKPLSVVSKKRDCPCSGAFMAWIAMSVRATLVTF